MSIPNSASLAGTVLYNDGITPFDGWVLLMLAYPTGYSFATVANQLIPQRLGDRVKVRIQKGVYDQSARVYFNSSLEPPGTKYAAFFYDNNDSQLGNTGLFTVSTSPYTITVPSLALPTAASVVPTPSSTVTGTVMQGYHDEIPVGAIDNVNTLYTINFPPVLLDLKINGLSATPTTDYTVSGNTITLTSAMPVGTLIRALYFT